MKKRMGTPPKPRTIKEWHDLSPSSKVNRTELMMVLEGFEFLPSTQVAQLIKNALVLERERHWYRALWRWVKVNLPWQKQTLKDLPKQTRDQLRDELDRADDLDAKQEQLEDEVDAQQAAADSEREAEDAGA